MRCQRRAPQRRAAALVQHIGRAHAAQVAHQVERRRVAHGEPVDVDHRQRKAGALQQRAEFAHIGKRRNARRDAAFDLALGLREGLAQFGQRVAAEQRGEQQAVGLERAADLDERAGQIVDELQRQRRDDEIERAVGERQASSSAATRGRFAPRRRAAAIERADLAACRERAAHRVGRRAEIDRALEAAQHRAEPLAEFGRDAVDQERRRAARTRARWRRRSSARSNSCAACHGGRRCRAGHGRAILAA